MSATNNKIIGNRGETIARKYLEHNNYTVIGQNYHSGHLEIDLIARRNNQLVFIEVKTRIKNRESLTENPLNKWQTANLKRAIVDYCYKNRVNFDTVHLDLIVILINQSRKTADLKHYQDVF